MLFIIWYQPYLHFTACLWRSITQYYILNILLLFYIIPFLTFVFIKRILVKFLKQTDLVDPPAHNRICCSSLNSLWVLDNAEYQLYRIGCWYRIRILWICHASRCLLQILSQCLYKYSRIFRALATIISECIQYLYKIISFAWLLWSYII